jgi:hypothetical protein
MKTPTKDADTWVMVSGGGLKLASGYHRRSLCRVLNPKALEWDLASFCPRAAVDPPASLTRTRPQWLGQVLERICHRAFV